MSAFLGPIHFWLYNKIRFQEDLIDALCARAVSEGWITEEDTQKFISTDRRELQDAIDESNIHGWLHNQLQTSSVREATFIKDLTDCGGDDGIDAVLEAFIKQGAMCGTEAKEKLTAQTAPAIYTVMQDYYVNGMPCDPSDTVIEQTDTTFSWYGNHQNQISYWKTAGVNPIIMAAAFQAWFSAFVSHVAPDFAFNVNLDGDIPVYTIAKS